MMRFNQRNSDIKEGKTVKTFKQLMEDIKPIVETRVEHGLEDHHPRIVSGVKGMKSKPFSKKFKNQEHMEKWMDSEDYGNHDVHQIEKA